MLALAIQIILQLRRNLLSYAWTIDCIASPRHSDLRKYMLALMRYCAKLMFAGDPVIVTCRSAEPSVALAILICAPDICLISFILLPCLPIMQPIKSLGIVSSWELVGVVASSPGKPGVVCPRGVKGGCCIANW